MLKKRQDVGLIVKERAPDEKPENSDDSNDSIEACAHDLIEAVHKRDIKGAAEAMRAAFEIMETEPHDEAPHTYDAQNQKAAE